MVYPFIFTIHQFPPTIALAPITRKVEVAYNGAEMSVSVGGVPLGTQSCYGKHNKKATVFNGPMFFYV